MKAYGINKKNSVNSPFEGYLEEFQELGYTIITDEISQEELISLRSELDRIYTQQENEFGADKLDKINERNLARIPLAYSDLYVKLAARKTMMPYVRQILGDFFVLHLQNGIINMPNEEHHQSSWHRDLPYQNWISSEPLACNLFYCLDDFSIETGGTQLLPFSHQYDHAPSEQFMEKHAVSVVAPAGSVILFNSMCFHKAGFNSSKDKIRRGVNHLYTKPIISQQIDLPRFLNGKYKDDNELKMILGYENVVADSVTSFRNKRLSKF